MNRKLVGQILKSAPRLFILIGVLLLLNVVLFCYYAIFQQRHVERLQSRWFEARKSLSGGGQDILATYRQGEDDLKAWRDRIILKKDFARFVGSLFEAAANNSLAFNNINYKTSQFTAENLAAYRLDFNVTGKYAGIKSFIADIGHMREILTIDNISLNNSDPTSDAVGLKVQLTVYLRPEE